MTENHALPRLAARLFNTPLLVLPGTAELLAVNLSARFAGLGPAPGAQQISDDPEGDPFDEPYRVTNGVATIPIRGELVNRGSWMSSASGLTSYDAIQSALRQAAADPRVERIALDIDSPGGEASGAMETADEVRQLSRLKPVTSYVNSLAASAAYVIAAGAKEIVVSPSSTVGSIGVVWLHLDRSKMLSDEGLKPTLLYAGAYKVDGHPFTALDGDARARIQAQIDDVYSLLTDTIGKMRPKLSSEGARKTEAGLYIGRKAVDAGLADRVGMFPAKSMRGPSRMRMTTRILMAVALNKAGESHASSLIDDGKVDKTSSWSFSAEDGDKLLGSGGDDWAEYGRFHLGVDSEESQETKARWKYPYGKDGKVYRSGVIAAKSRAAQQGVKAIEDAADRLLEKIDGEKKEAEEDKNEQQEKEAAMADAMALAAAKNEGVKEGAAAERARIKSILESDAAKGKNGLARQMALTTGMSAEEAAVLLASAALEAAPGARMAQVPTPAIRPDSSQRAANPEGDADANWAAIAAEQNKRAGVKGR